jgi:ubiquinone/menaquinone biosynthesis C-methylase UbiE
VQREHTTNDLEDKVAAFWQHDAASRSKNFYNTYDYSAFWKGRVYEDRADRIAVQRLMKRIPPPHRNIVDIGGGIGRLASLYEERWEHAAILDPSHTQLAVAKKNVAHPDRVDFVEGSVESIPLPPGSCDTALCVRTFHYVESPRRAIKEIWRILTPGGYLILEIPNKIHFEARLEALVSGRSIDSRDSISRSTEYKDILFLNHHPQAIQDILLTEWFDVVEVLSVSNFRSRFFKRITPLRILLFFEKLLQRPLARFWFGPSIYFLARKKVHTL